MIRLTALAGMSGGGNRTLRYACIATQTRSVDCSAFPVSRILSYGPEACSQRAGLYLPFSHTCIRSPCHPSCIRGQVLGSGHPVTSSQGPLRA